MEFYNNEIGVLCSEGKVRCKKGSRKIKGHGRGTLWNTYTGQKFQVTGKVVAWDDSGQFN